MTTAGGIAILALFFGAAVLYASLPGIGIGFIIGLLIERKGWRRLACLVVSFAAGSAFYRAWVTDPHFSSVAWLGMCAAPLLPMLLGGWLGSKFRKSGDAARASGKIARVDPRK